MSEIRNAVITRADILIEDHGLLTGWLYLDYGSASQGFGGWALYLPKSFKNHRIDSPAGHYIYRVLKVAGVERWADLPGKTVRVRAEHTKVHAIGHIINDDWFCPADDFSGATMKEGDAR